NASASCQIYDGPAPRPGDLAHWFHVLERVSAGVAEVDRAAEGRAEEGFEGGVGRAAQGTRDGGEVGLDGGGAGRVWRGEAKLFELAAALRGDAVGGPGRVEDDFDLDVGDAGGANGFDDVAADKVDSRAAGEGGGERDADAAMIDDQARDHAH